MSARGSGSVSLGPVLGDQWSDWAAEWTHYVPPAIRSIAPPAYQPIEYTNFYASRWGVVEAVYLCRETPTEKEFFVHRVPHEGIDVLIGRLNELGAAVPGMDSHYARGPLSHYLGEYRVVIDGLQLEIASWSWVQLAWTRKERTRLVSLPTAYRDLPGWCDLWSKLDGKLPAI